LAFGGWLLGLGVELMDDVGSAYEVEPAFLITDGMADCQNWVSIQGV